MATLEDEINIHNDIEPDQQLEYNLQYDIKEEHTDTTDHTKKHSSLFDLDFTPQKSFKSQEQPSRNPSLQSTESVEVYIYRRTSLVSTGSNLMKMDDTHDSDINTHNGNHQTTETGQNLWEHSSKNVNEYEFQTDNPTFNAYEYEDTHSDIHHSHTNMHNSMDISTPVPMSAVANDNNGTLNYKNILTETAENTKQISMTKMDENKARHSLSVTDVHSVIIHDSDDSENMTLSHSNSNSASVNGPTRVVRATSIIYYDSGNANILIKDSQINESRNSFAKLSHTHLVEHTNKSSILEMIDGSDIYDINNIIKPNDTNDCSDEQFYRSFQEKERNSQNRNENLLLKSNKKMGKPKREMTMDIKPQILTAKNLVKHDFEKGKLSVQKEIKPNNKRRYISMTGEQSYSSMNVNREISNHNYRKKKLSTKIKYMTALGCACALTILVGFAMYSKNRNGVIKTKYASDILITPTKRRGPPRIG